MNFPETDASGVNRRSIRIGTGVGESRSVKVTSTIGEVSMEALASSGGDVVCLVPPKLTTAQRDAITAPTAGLLIYNTTTNKLNVRVAAAWEAVTSA